VARVNSWMGAMASVSRFNHFHLRMTSRRDSRDVLGVARVKKSLLAWQGMCDAPQSSQSIIHRRHAIPEAVTTPNPNLSSEPGA